MTPPVEAALTEYLLALEAGTAPPREDWLARHPEWRTELAQFLETHARVQSTFASLRDTPTPRPFPQRFGPYSLLGELGAGGMGIVYRARHDQHDRDVALKMIRGTRFCRQAEVMRFRVEVAAAMRLSHPNVAEVLDAGEIDGQPYFTMPVLDAGNLYHHRIRFAPTPQQAAAIVRDLARGVEHAHRNGVLHRDLKPSNVLFDAAGQPHLADFGLAKLLSDSDGLTGTGQMVGTPAFAAPECFRREAATTATDVYGLGGLLYFALTGQPPAAGTNEPELLASVLNRDPAPPGRLNPAVPRDLDAIALQCLAKDPRRRYSSAAAAADDLERYLAGRSVTARPPGRVEKAARTVRRHPMIAALVAAVIALAALSGWTAWQRHGDTNRLNRQLQKALDEERERYREARQFDYASRVQSAADLLGKGHLQDAAELLSPLIPAADEEDIREYAWHHLWRTARTRQRIDAHRKGIAAVAVSPDGRYYATAGNDDQIALVDPDSGRVLRKWATTVASGDHHFFKLCFTRDSRQIVTGFTEYSASTTKLDLWDIATGASLANYRVPMNRLGGFVPMEDGTIHVFGGTDQQFSGQMYKWNPTTNEVRRYRNDRDGAFMHVTDVVNDQYVYLVRSKFLGLSAAVCYPMQLELSRNILRQVGPVDATCTNLSCSPDGKWLAASDSDNRIYIWDLDGEMKLVCKHPLGPTLRDAKFVWTHSSQELYVVSSVHNQGSITFRFSAPDWQKIESESRTPSVAQLEYDPYRKTILLGGIDGALHIRRPLPARLSGNLTGHAGEVWAVAFSPDGQTLASAGDDHTVKLHDWTTREVRTELIGHRSLVLSVANAPDGKTIYTGDYDGVIRSWDPTSGEPLRIWQDHSDAVNRIAVSPDGRWLASVGRDSKVAVRNLSNHDSNGPISIGNNRCYALDFSPDSRLLMVGQREHVEYFEIPSLKKTHGTSEQEFSMPRAILTPSGETILGNQKGRVTVIGTSGAPPMSFQAHEKAINALAGSPDGRTIATGSLDGGLRLWHRRTGRLLAELVASGPQVNGLAFSPDGRCLASCDHTGVVRLWPGE